MHFQLFSLLVHCWLLGTLIRLQKRLLVILGIPKDKSSLWGKQGHAPTVLWYCGSVEDQKLERRRRTTKKIKKNLLLMKVLSVSTLIFIVMFI